MSTRWSARHRVLRWTLALMAPLALTPVAQAITFERLNAAGEGSGSFYTPDLSDWIMAPASDDSSVLPTSAGWLLSMGQSSFGASEGGSQLSDIYGAGVILPESTHGWRVNFSANLRTWDSYNDGSVVSPNPNGSLGDWDLFAVNMNQSNFYWDLVSTSSGGGEGGGEIPVDDMPALAALSDSGGLIDPLVPVRPAGSVVTYTNGGDSQYLPGSTWAWGGRDYAEGYFESVQTNGSIQNTGSGPTFVSFVLDTRTPSFNDNNYPSWGQFGTPGVFANVPDGVADGGGDGSPGLSPDNPLLPISATEDGSFVFNDIEIGDDGVGIDEFLFIDPEVAVGYQFEIVAGSAAFAEVLLPTLGDADGYTIEVLVDGVWTKLADVADGGSFAFDGSDTFLFRVMGIDPELGLNPENFAAFVTGIKVTQGGPIDLTMTPITTAVPEPGTYALMLAGLAAVMVARRRKV